MIDSSVLTVEIADLVATVWLDRSDKLNAMNRAFWSDLPSIMDSLSADAAVRVVVIAGKGKAFTVGIDLMDFGPSLMGGGDGAKQRFDFLADVKMMQRTMTAVAECSKPVIAAVHGWCLGGGIDLITACDIRLAAADAIFSVRETKMAIVADVGTLQRLPKIVDPGWVAELVYTGRDVDATEAEAMGLVSHVYPDADSTFKAASEMAAAIAANSPIVVQGAKAVMRNTEGMTTDAALDYVAVWNAAFLHSKDLQEAMAAFMEKRPPEFRGE